MTIRAGNVMLDGELVGQIAETGTGTEFRYDPTWLGRPDAVPVSVTLPLRQEPHVWPRGLHPFFENLLPEGWLLELAVSKLKIPADDPFGLLLATCRDCIGAVEIEPASRWVDPVGDEQA